MYREETFADYSARIRDSAPDQATSATLDELAAAARLWDAEFSTTESAPAEHFDIKEDVLTFAGNSIPMDQGARNRLLAKAGAPVGYLSDRSINIQILALLEHLRQGDIGDTLKAVLQNDQLFTIQRSDLVELTYSEVLGAVRDVLGKSADDLLVSRIDRADGRLELDLVSPAKALKIRRGDVVQGGLHIMHHRYGDQATYIHAYIYRLVCKNGMTRRECVSAEGIVRTRKLPVSHPRAKELLLDQIRRLTVRTWDKLEPQLTELRATSERQADVNHLLRQWLQRSRISTRVTGAGGADPHRTVMDRLLNAWREHGEAEESLFAAVNALTWVGSHDLQLSVRQRRVLSLLGGLLAFSGVHICPRCFSVLSDSAQPGAERLAETALATHDTNSEATGLASL